MIFFLFAFNAVQDCYSLLSFVAHKKFLGGTLRILIACFYVGMCTVYQVPDDTTF